MDNGDATDDRDDDDDDGQRRVQGSRRMAMAVDSVAADTPL